MQTKVSLAERRTIEEYPVDRYGVSERRACQLHLARYARNPTGCDQAHQQILNEPDGVVFRNAIFRHSGNNLLWLRTSASMKRFMTTSRRGDGVIIASRAFLHSLGQNWSFELSCNEINSGDHEVAAVDFYVVIAGYAFLRLAIPTSPSNPEPKSQAAAGTGTTVADEEDHEKVSWVAVCPLKFQIPWVASNPLPETVPLPDKRRKLLFWKTTLTDVMSNVNPSTAHTDTGLGARVGLN